MKIFKCFVLLAMVMSLAIFGCGKKEEETALSPHDTGEIPLEPQQDMMAGPAEVVIPDDVKASWKGISIEIANSETGEKQVVIVNIGEEKDVEGAGLKIKALSFLPAFQMDGPTVTSRSNDPDNPAAQIEVYEGESRLFKGWLFTLYPTTHAFAHPKYSITLLEGVAAGKS